MYLSEELAKFKMLMKFSKYQGAGNDFIIVDDRDEIFDLTDQALISHLCDRRFGIGADGLILLRNHKNFDFEMVYFNSDGAPSSMCGNGGRCIVRFADAIGIPQHGKYSFLAVDGPHQASIEGQVIHLKMSDVENIELLPEGKKVETGSPHLILEREELDIDNFVEEARAYRNAEAFKEKGINVNYILLEGSTLKIRTYERGVEDETLACGTGVTAAALSVFDPKIEEVQSIEVKARGGDLSVRAKANSTGGYEDVWLTGPADFVYSGEIEL